VIGAYHQLWRIERSFRMSKHDLQARPIYHHKRESIEAHLAVVLAALAVTHEIETMTGWSIKRFVQTARRYRTIATHRRSRPHRRTAATGRPARRPRRDHLTRVAHQFEPSRDDAAGVFRWTSSLTISLATGSASRRTSLAAGWEAAGFRLG
jgi:hypothetical protein